VHSAELTLPLSFDPASPTATEADVMRLFDEVGPGLRRYLRSRRLSREAADDVLQETFVALFRHLRLGRSRDNLRGWLFEVARRLAVRHQRRANRRLKIELPWTSTLVGAIRDPKGTPEFQISEQQRIERLQRVVEAMPARDRECLMLRAEGLRYREIAQALGVSLGGVAKSLARGLDKIANAERSCRDFSTSSSPRR
jgi:RNA polymerase sigma-70 factor (ECF subfamily)